jgi:hypothetical protein
VVGFTTNTRFDGTVDQKYVYQRTRMKFTDEGMVEEKILFFKTESGNKRRVCPAAIQKCPPSVLKQINDEIFPLRAANIKVKNEEIQKKIARRENLATDEDSIDSARSSASSIARAAQRKEIRHAHVCKTEPCLACDEGLLCYDTWKYRRFNGEHANKMTVEYKARHKMRSRHRQARKAQASNQRRGSILLEEAPAKEAVEPFSHYNKTVVEKAKAPVAKGEMAALRHYQANCIGTKSTYSWETRRLAEILK